MEANFTKYIVSKLNALGIYDEELDNDSLENILKFSIQCQKGLDQIQGVPSIWKHVQL